MVNRILITALVLAMLGTVSYACLCGGDEAVTEPMPESPYPKPNEVRICGIMMEMPLGRILLVKHKTEYGAIRFTEFVPDARPKYATLSHYESYYQKDGTGDFKAKNVMYRKDEVRIAFPKGFGRMTLAFGGRHIIHCGPMTFFGVLEAKSAFGNRGAKCHLRML